MATIYQNGIQYSGSGEPLIYDDMGGATSTTDGVHGLVPAPSAGDNEKFLSGDGSWKSIEEYVTKTASGNPIEVSDSANAPLVKCVSAITGSQDLHGYDKPWVGGAGKNKLEVTATTQTINGVTFTVNDDGSVLVNGTATANAIFSLCSSLSLSAGEYIISNEFANNKAYIELAGKGATASGKQATFTWNGTETNTPYIAVINGYTADNLLFKPMIRLSTESDSTFSPYSNICPITAYTEGEIEVRGKNLFDKDNANSITAYVTANSGLLEAGTTEHSIYLYLEQGTYTVQRIIPSSDTTTKRFRFRLFRNVPQIGETGDVLYDGSTELTATVTLPYSGYLLIFMFNGDSAWNARQEVFNSMQIEEGSTATTYEPYTSTTHTTTYPSAIYRGSEDCVKGEVMEEWKKVVFDGTEGWTRVSTDYRIFAVAISDIKNPASTEQRKNGIISSYFPVSTGTAIASSMDDKSMLKNNGMLYIRNMDCATVSDFIQVVAGMEFAYEIATPTTSSVTPTNLPIKSLSGYTHIESSTGDMEIEYITDKYQPIVDLISESGGGGDSYGETTLWESASGTYGQITLSDNLSNYDAICVIMAPNNEPTYRSSPIIPVSVIDTTGVTHFGIYVSGATSYCSSMTYVDDTHISCDSWASNYPMLYFKVVGIKYGGSSQQTVTLTRSLSKSTEKTSLKPISEPLTDKTEDSPSEDEKSIKTDENTVTEEER